MELFEGLLDKLQVFEKLYQQMRVVDPVEKKVFEIKDGSLRESERNCHSLWGKQRSCTNCISRRALLENDSIIKFECDGDTIFMITAVPMTIQGKTVVVELIKNTTNSLFMLDSQSNGSVQVLSMIERMNNEAVKDALTEVFNRRYINERLPVELLHASGRDEPVSVLFADIDYFKKVNDTYGHMAGDLVLKEFALEISRHIRKDTDWVARYGGEEFLVCLPGLNYESARIVAERIRRHVEKKEFHFNGRKVRITCSLGVYTASGDIGNLALEKLIELADKQLYKAKNTGRNRVV